MHIAIYVLASGLSQSPDLDDNLYHGDIITVTMLLHVEWVLHFVGSYIWVCIVKLSWDSQIIVLVVYYYEYFGVRGYLWSRK